MTARPKPERASGKSAEPGLVIVDKPAGMTSHDVVARIRRLAGTRRVGHAGTLDPMATGVLVVGVEQATRLLGHLTLAAKEYQATIRLGQSTTTDDAEGEPTGGCAARGVSATLLIRGGAPLPGGSTPGPSDPELLDRIRAEAAALTGEIMQVPPGVSAIKVNGQRAYKLTRAGAAPEMKPRPVTVYSFDVTGVVPAGDFTDVDATIRCSSGTYIRALARDLGAALGTGGHLTALRRTSVGAYDITQARTLEDLAERYVLTPLPQAASAAFVRVELTDSQAQRLAHGAQLPLRELVSAPETGTVAGADAGSNAEVLQDAVPGDPLAAFAPDGALVALVTVESDRLRSLAVFPPAAG